MELLERRLSHDGFFKLEICRLRHTLFRGGWSPPLTREVLARGHAVAVLPYDPDSDRVVLVEQFRIGAHRAGRNPWLLELVAGFAEEGEEAEEVARREAREEAGLELLELIRLHHYQTSPGADAEHITLFCARIHAPERGGCFGLAREGEDIRTHVLDFERAMEYLNGGRIDSATPLIALQWLALNRESLRRRWC